MALKHILTLALVLLPSAAYADCASEARAAREAILKSGPFQYKSRQWNKYSDWLKIGVIEPNKAERILEWTMDSHVQHWALEEQITIGQQGWTKDSFGWRSSWPKFLPYELAIPQSPYEASNTQCLGRVEVEGKSLIGYEQNAKILDWNFVEKIFVDPDSRLTVRYERIYVLGTNSSGNGSWDNVTSTYSYDASIKIEPPKVDLAERREKSFKAFQRDVDSSDPACRQEVIEIINRGQTASPFLYKRIGIQSEIAGMHGTFAPPSSFHDISEDGFGNWHASETLQINERAWKCSHKSEWEEYNAHFGTFTSLGFVAASDYIGGTKCLGEVDRDHNRYGLYEYAVYGNTPSEYKSTLFERVLISKLRMYVMPAEKLPTIFETFDKHDEISDQFVRAYDKSISITPPSGACSIPERVTRF
ncbi:MAG: hypothetical protein ACLPX9_04080 [Rhodomicrobium sp.]